MIKEMLLSSEQSRMLREWICERYDSIPDSDIDSRAAVFYVSHRAIKGEYKTPLTREILDEQLSLQREAMPLLSDEEKECVFRQALYEVNRRIWDLCREIGVEHPYFLPR